ncbi:MULTISPECIES: phage terminase small subunit [Brenneria]|uniref:Terminase n=1 Tax=Brenneria nigrifluens DSM 30175 = ATCC 13028 TaxID=1121120 RepID=A0A2U1UQE0_9GAMM|nr:MULTISPECIES: phage terminase small subunit [Brenneria]EHD23634.1 small terminase subunit [Brenneria sp. EniD312]PWC23890.1 terminase [Brenneria nigrifluens] [Brenneria nigrifluens DSM 30175 = ATCC 13028]QCR06561.1 terminase [Brenneria nigrifluens] [Brenneria nigrifluens DSM 30175 = ATCC 13028]
MLTPAQRHFQKVMAERHGKTDELTDTARTAHEQILHRLRMDQSALRRVQSDQAKAELKKQLLPQYEGWIDGTLEGDSGRQDEVIVTLMVWAIDAADYQLAVRIGRYVIAHSLAMPDRFNRTAPTVLVEEICDPILVQVKANDSADISTYLTVLDEVAQIVDGKDMPDQVRAKLFKTRAFALRSGTEADQATALEYLREALKLDAGAGVKKEIERLARLVKKNSQAADAEAGNDAGNAADSGAEASLDSAVVATTTSKTAARKTTSKTAAKTRKTTPRKVAEKKAATGKTE